MTTSPLSDCTSAVSFKLSTVRAADMQHQPRSALNLVSARFNGVNVHSFNGHQLSPNPPLTDTKGEDLAKTKACTTQAGGIKRQGKNS